MDVKTILKLATNPLVTGALGGYIAREKFGKKYGNVLAMVGGGLAGAIAGSLVQTYVLGSDQPAQQLPPAQQGYGLPPQQVALNFARPQVPALPPPATGAQPLPQAEGIFGGTSYDTSDGAVADQAALEAFGRGSGDDLN